MPSPKFLFWNVCIQKNVSISSFHCFCYLTFLSVSCSSKTRMTINAPIFLHYSTSGLSFFQMETTWWAHMITRLLGNKNNRVKWIRLVSTDQDRLRVVFKWLMKAFSGYLPAEQVLQLWDLLLAYNSIQILPLFAMGVLSIRKDNLMKAQLPQTVDVS